MFKKVFVTLTVALLCNPLFAADNSNREHYKCYIQLMDKSKIVHQFVTAESSKKEFMQQLVSRSVFASDGVTSLKINDIYECVKVKDNFKSKEARKVEAETPF